MKLIIGHLGDAYGVKGWLHLISYANPPENIFNYQHWTVKQNQSLQIESYKPHGNHFVIKLLDCNDRDQALQYKHHDIFIDRSELPQLKKNEYYWSDLEGLTVINQENIVLGRVDHLFETGSNDVLVVKGEREYLIPYLMGNTVLIVDIDKKTLSVDWDAEF